MTICGAGAGGIGEGGAGGGMVACLATVGVLHGALASLALVIVAAACRIISRQLGGGSRSDLPPPICRSIDFQ